jgi:hypothetical protein
MSAFPQSGDATAVVFDLEFTAWKGSVANRLSRPGQFTELVQIDEFLGFIGCAPIVAFGRDDLIFVTNLRLYGIRDAPPLPPYINIVR